MNVTIITKKIKKRKFGLKSLGIIIATLIRNDVELEHSDKDYQGKR